MSRRYDDEREYARYGFRGDNRMEGRGVYYGGPHEREGVDRGYGYGREGSYGSHYGGRYDRGYSGGDERSARVYGGRGQDERDWLDRTRDEVASWFGDEAAHRRRRRNERRAG